MTLRRTARMCGRLRALAALDASAADELLRRTAALQTKQREQLLELLDAVGHEDLSDFVGLAQKCNTQQSQPGRALVPTPSTVINTLPQQQQQQQQPSGCNAAALCSSRTNHLGSINRRSSGGCALQQPKGRPQGISGHNGLPPAGAPPNFVNLLPAGNLLAAAAERLQAAAARRSAGMDVRRLGGADTGAPLQPAPAPAWQVAACALLRPSSSSQGGPTSSGSSHSGRPYAPRQVHTGQESGVRLSLPRTTLTFAAPSSSLDWAEGRRKTLRTVLAAAHMQSHDGPLTQALLLTSFMHLASQAAQQQYLQQQQQQQRRASSGSASKAACVLRPASSRASSAGASSVVMDLTVPQLPLSRVSRPNSASSPRARPASDASTSRLGAVAR
jgi:hypothetical protein